MKGLLPIPKGTNLRIARLSEEGAKCCSCKRPAHAVLEGVVQFGEAPEWEFCEECLRKKFGLRPEE